MHQPNLSRVAEDGGDPWASSPGLGGFPAWEPAGSTPRLLPSPPPVYSLWKAERRRRLVHVQVSF